MLVLKIKTRGEVESRSVNFRFPDGNEGRVEMLQCSRTGVVTVGIEMPSDVTILRGTLLPESQPAAA